MIIRSLLQHVLILLLIGALSSQAIAASVMSCQMQSDEHSSISSPMSHDTMMKMPAGHSMSDQHTMSNQDTMSHSAMMLDNTSMGDCCEQQCQCPMGGCFVSALMSDTFLLHFSPLDNVGDLSLLNHPIHSTDTHFRPPALNI